MDNDLLKYAVDNGMIDLSYVQEQIEMKKREELLERHPYKIWEGKDGKWYTYLPDRKKGRVLRKKSSRKAVEDDVADYWRQELENPCLRDVFEEWIDRKLEMGEISAPTYERYKIDFGRFCGDICDRRIKSVSQDEIEDFLIGCVVKFHLTTKSFSNLKTIVRGVFKRAKKKKYVDFSITETINDMEVSKKVFRSEKKPDADDVFDEDEFAKVGRCLCESPDIVNMGLLLAFVTGLRVGELAALKWSDYDGICIRVQRTETRYRDGGGSYVYGIKDDPKTDAGIRDVVIPPGCLWVVKKIRLENPFGEYMFEKDGERVKTYSFRKRLYLVCDKSGVPRKSPHKIRKTYASILLDSQLSEKFITDMMGHTDIQCTNQFYGRNRKTKEKKAEILNGIPEFSAVSR